MKKANLDESIFNILLLVISCIVIIMSFSFNHQARVFPMLFGIIIFIMVLLQTIVHFSKKTPKYLRFVNKSGLIENFGGQGQLNEDTENNKPKNESEPVVTWKGVGVVLLWIVAYVILMSIINYLLATLIFLIFFLRFAGKMSWLVTILFSGIFSGALYVLFGLILS